MTPKVTHISPLPNFCLHVRFSDGAVKLYDVKPLADRLPVFKELLSDEEIFSGVYVDVGGHGIVWNDDFDLSSDELWHNGTTINN